jgi:hypothetical protein
MVGSVFKFGADTTEYNKAVEAMPRKMRQAAQQIEANANNISTGFNKLRNVMGSLGVAFGASAIVGQLRRVMDSLDRVNDLAIRFGTSAESIQRVGEAARLSGTDIDTVARAMTKAGVAATEAVSKGGEAAETFKRAGINAKEFEQAGLDRKLIMVAEAFKAANGDAGKQNEILKLIGMRAADLIPLISNLDELKASMADASVVSDEAVKRIAKANDELDKMAFKMQANIFAPAIIGALDLIERLEDVNERAGFLEKSLRLAYALPTGGASLLFGGKTEEERNKAANEEQALRNLQQRGQMPQNVDPNNVDVQMAIARELEAMEKKRKAAEEAEAAQKRINSLKEFEDTLNKKSVEAETEKAAASEKRVKQEAEASQFKQYMLELDLKIKEAQADGNAEREASLTALKNWTEAIVKYEGDLDKTARDVNATLRDRNRLRDDEAAKQRAAIEAELKHVETMAFGTEEAKNRAEWMDEYNRRVGEGATDEQAKRFANAASFKPTSESSFGGGGGGGGGGLGPSVSGASMSENMRVADLRGSARQATRNQRASDLAAAGMYRSAIRAQDAGQRAYDRSMQAAADRDMAGNFDFAGRPAGNMGEAMKSVQDKLGKMEALDRMRDPKGYEPGKGYDPTKGETENMKNAIRAGKFDDAMSEMAKEQSKTPEERRQEEEEARNKSKAPGGGGDSGKGQNQTEGKLDRIVQLMEERLPIRVLAKAA